MIHNFDSSNSGRLALPPTAETWKLNEKINVNTFLKFDAIFCSKWYFEGQENQLYIGMLWETGGDTWAYRYPNDRYEPQSVWDSRWFNESYRTITFLEPPTGDLLKWLQENAVKQ